MPPVRALAAAWALAAIVATIVATGAAAQQAGSWTPAGVLIASNAGEDDHLGAGDALTGVALAVSRDGRTLVAGATHEDSAARGINGNQKDETAFEAGAVYVFAPSGSGWAQQAYIKASNAQAGDQFGFTVALSGDGTTLAVSANFEDGGALGVNGNQADESAPGAGAVYVFARSGTTWTQQAYLKASNIAEGDRFGYSLSLSDDGDTLAVGAIGEDSSATGVGGSQTDNSADQAGATYVFARTGGTWSQQAYLKASNTQGGDMFGFSVAHLHIEDEGVDALGELLAHDGAGDERDALDGRGDVAESVELLVCGTDAAGLSEEAAAERGDQFAEAWEGLLGGEAGDGLELVEGAAGVAEPSSRDHGDGDAGGGDERCEDEGDFVADAAGAVLVGLGGGDVGEVEYLAGAEHLAGPGGELRVVHAAEEEGHEQGRHLVVGDGAVGVAGEEVGELFVGEVAVVALSLDEFGDKHGRAPHRKARR